MSKITPKYQVTVPKSANPERLPLGEEADCIPSSDAIRAIPSGKQKASAAPSERVGLFDKATERLQARSAGRKQAPPERGWTRADLYDRSRSQ